MNKRWEIWELKLALNLYCKLPFGQYHSHNPEVIKLAKILNRTPSAVAMKLCNFASLDKVHQKRGVKGLSHGSKNDILVWQQFHEDVEGFILESEKILQEHKGKSLIDEISNDLPHVDGLEREAIVRQRVNQQFFRRMVLASYRYRCAVCMLPIESLLVASHIVPWAVNKKIRMDPRNGIALCSLHDKAFDTGLITVDVRYYLRLSPVLDRFSKEPAIVHGFLPYKDNKILLPDRFLPLEGYLKYHFENVFVASVSK